MEEDFELLLYDRVKVIQAMDKKYDLRTKSYISFSGGKDSTVLSHLIDIALPDNNIPRVFMNTGIEYLDIVKFVREQAKNDTRFKIINPTRKIKDVLETYGYPMKSKQHSHNLSIYQHSGIGRSIERYLGIIESSTKFRCPKCLRYQFTQEFNIKCSDKCCYKLKKEPAMKWQKENGKSIALTGMRKEEGGERASIGCIVTDKDKNLVKFHPLLVVSDEWEEWFIKANNIQLCRLYYPPFNFKRTGCKGCPFSLDLQHQLDVMEQYLPEEKTQCEVIWKPVYFEYRTHNYRLRKYEQLSLFSESEENDND